MSNTNMVPANADTAIPSHLNAPEGFEVMLTRQVAATALYHGLAIVTSRTGRFRRIPGLQVRPLPRSRRRP